MAFQFSLSAVLQLRQSLEHQQELLLLEANRQMASLQLRIDHVNQQLWQHATQESMQLAAALCGAELQFMQLCQSILLGQRVGLEKQLAATQVMRDSRLASFRQARQQREVLATLRQAQQQVYGQNQDRRDQRQLDDLLLLRRAYLRRG